MRRGCVVEAAGAVRLEVIWKTNLLGWADAELHCAKEGREGKAEVTSLVIESFNMIALPPLGVCN